MRISDWVSDVCSSDLAIFAAVPVLIARLDTPTATCSCRSSGDRRRVSSEPDRDFGKIASNNHKIRERRLRAVIVSLCVRLITLKVDPQGRGAGSRARQAIDDK